MTAKAADKKVAWENPLMPNARLRQIYVAMMQARVLARTLPSRRRDRATLGNEACLVSPAIDLGAGDLVSDALGGGTIDFLRGAKLAGCMQSTGEGSLSPYHQQGGDIVWQIGTGYFGARDAAGHFDLAKAVDVVAANPVRMIEIKLSQGAKPGLGGVLPGKKVTAEIAAIRGVAFGKDCISPSAHTAFHDIDVAEQYYADYTGRDRSPADDTHGAARETSGGTIRGLASAPPA